MLSHHRRIDKRVDRRTRIDDIQGGARGKRPDWRGGGSIQVQGRRARGKRTIGTASDRYKGGGRGERDASAGGGSIATEATRRCRYIVAAADLYKGGPSIPCLVGPTSRRRRRKKGKFIRYTLYCLCYFNSILHNPNGVRCCHTTAG